MPNFGTIITETRYLLDEVTEATSHWADDWLKAWINEMQGDAAMRIPPALMPKLTGLGYLTLSGTVPEHTFSTEHIRLGYVAIKYTTSGVYRLAKLYTPDEINNLTDNQFLAGTVLYPNVIVWGQILTISPLTGVNVPDGVKVYFVKPPTDMTADGNTPEIPQFAHRWIALGAASKALQQDGDGRYVDLWNQYLEKFKRFEVK